MLLQQLMERDLESFFRTPTMDAKIARYPLTNLGIDKNKNLHVEVAIAGFGKDDVELELKGNRLLIRGRKDATVKDEEVEYMQRHISNTSFERSIILHENYVGGDIKANVADGILKVLVEPKEQQKKLIKIN